MTDPGLKPSPRAVRRAADGRRDAAARVAGTATSATSDEALVEATLAGAPDAFEILVRRHRRGLVSHIFRQVGHREMALDLAQDVFLKVYVSLSSFDPRYRFTTWLYRIGSNCAIDHLRRKQPKTCSITPDTEAERAGDVARTFAGSDPTPHEMLRYRELQRRLDVAVGNLPPDYRQLILLRHRQHCRYDEIARIASLPIGTVKNRIFRAREMLRHELGDLLGSEG